MKKLISLALALTMAFTLVLPALSVPVSTVGWNAGEKRFELHDPPIITRILENTWEEGTEVDLRFRMSDEAMALAESYYKNKEDYERTIAEQLGMDPENVSGWFHVSVQIAYSFDGTNWVNDWNVDNKATDPDDGPVTQFDRDGDGFLEYYDLPTESVSITDRYVNRTIFDAAASHMNARYCSDKPESFTVREALTKRNNAILQGRGEYLGNYDPDDDTAGCGFAVDFTKNTLYVKARYRVFTSCNYIVDGEWTNLDKVTQYSDWSEVKTFNNANRSFEGQNCVPDTADLNSSAPIELNALASERFTYTHDGKELKGTRYRFSIRYPEAMVAAFDGVYAIGEGDELAEYTGERYFPDLVFEMKVGDGDWYYLADQDVGVQFFTFSDEIDWIRNRMEAQGYQPNDPVYLRARILGQWSYNTENLGDYLDLVVPEDEILISSGYSNAVELNLTGKYNVEYVLDGGGFPEGTTQTTQFDDDTNEVVDLTAAEYTPAKRNYVFKGWFEDAAFTKPVTSFDTSVKMSRTFYAKWEELPYYTLTWDMGAITGYIYNPNPDRIYSDDGEASDGVIGINDVTYEGAAFLGWFDAAEGGNRITTLSFTAMTGDMTLYAHWELPTFTITYPGAGTDYTNDARNPAAFQVDPSGESCVKLYAPAKKGSIFDGWFYNENLKDGALSYDADAQAWLMDEGKDVTVYAKFILGRWNINYVQGIEGVYNGENPDQHTYGTAVELKDPTRTGYVFEGWYSDQAFTQKITSIPADTEGEVTLYARWTAKKYQIKYDLRDPDVEKCFANENPTERTVDDEIVLKPLTPNNRLYKFIGWYNNVNFDGDPVTRIAAGTDRDVTVYAKVQKYLWGDVNFDGEVTSADARLVLRQAVDLEKFTPEQLAWGDVDSHSEAHEINSADARKVLRMAVDLDSAESLKLPEIPYGF